MPAENGENAATNYGGRTPDADREGGRVPIDFRPVPAYWCPTCNYRIVVKPCPLCEARKRFPAVGRADHYAAEVALEARGAIGQARRLAEREAEG
jgi:hypothetical protein